MTTGNAKPEPWWFGALLTDPQLRPPRPDMYVLDANGEPEPCHDRERWAYWYEASLRARQIANDVTVDDVEVSTVFMGLDHAVSGPPVLWETMIFGGDHDMHQWRYTSRAAALRGHEHALRIAEGEIECDHVHEADTDG